jgi:hypothetical protein
VKHQKLHLYRLAITVSARFLLQQGSFPRNLLNAFDFEWADDVSASVIVGEVAGCRHFVLWGLIL